MPHAVRMTSAENHTADDNDFLLEVLELVRPDQIDNLLKIAKQEGKPIAEIVTEALWYHFKETRAIERYRKAHGLPEDWPLDEQFKEEEEKDDEGDEDS
jgi:hypothetical protein